MTADASISGCPSGLAPPSQSFAGDFSAFVREKRGIKTLTLSVRGAKCGGCLSKIESRLNALSGVQHARMNLSNGKLNVGWVGPVSADRIAKTVSDLGYGVSAFSEDRSAKDAKSEERDLLISMGVAAFALANVMLLSVSVWSGHGEMGERTRRGEPRAEAALLSFQNRDVLADRDVASLVVVGRPGLE